VALKNLRLNAAGFMFCRNGWLEMCGTRRKGNHDPGRTLGIRHSLRFARALKSAIAKWINDRQRRERRTGAFRCGECTPFFCDPDLFTARRYMIKQSQG
jgi:hypothetical protein